MIFLRLLSVVSVAFTLCHNQVSGYSTTRFYNEFHNPGPSGFGGYGPNGFNDFGPNGFGFRPHRFGMGPPFGGHYDECRDHMTRPYFRPPRDESNYFRTHKRLGGVEDGSDDIYDDFDDMVAEASSLDETRVRHPDDTRRSSDSHDTSIKKKSPRVITSKKNEDNHPSHEDGIRGIDGVKGEETLPDKCCKVNERNTPGKHHGSETHHGYREPYDYKKSHSYENHHDHEKPFSYQNHHGHAEPPCYENDHEHKEKSDHHHVHEKPSSYENHHGHEKPPSYENHHTYEKPPSYENHHGHEKPPSYENHHSHEKPPSYENHHGPEKPPSYENHHGHDKPSSYENHHGHEKPPSYESHHGHEKPHRTHGGNHEENIPEICCGKDDSKGEVTLDIEKFPEIMSDINNGKLNSNWVGRAHDYVCCLLRNSEKNENHQTYHDDRSENENHHTYHDDRSKNENHQTYHDDRSENENHHTYHDDRSKNENHQTYHDDRPENENHHTYHDDRTKEKNTPKTNCIRDSMYNRLVRGDNMGEEYDDNYKHVPKKKPEKKSRWRYPFGRATCNSESKDTIEAETSPFSCKLQLRCKGGAKIETPTILVVDKNGKVYNFYDLTVRQKHCVLQDGLKECNIYVCYPAKVKCKPNNQELCEIMVLKSVINGIMNRCTDRLFDSVYGQHLARCLCQRLSLI